jgi:DHA2 family multidrug resistance protein
MLLMGVIIFGTTQFIPQLLQEVLGYTATNAGLALTAGRPGHHRGDAGGGFLTGKVDARC